MVFSRQKTLLLSVFISICVCVGTVSISSLNSTSRQSDGGRRLRRQADVVGESYLQEYVDMMGDEYEQLQGRIDRNLQPEYEHLCQLVKKRIDLRDPHYEYRPPFYYEVWCKDYIHMGRFDVQAALQHKQVCIKPGFFCIQRTRTIYLSRRKVGHPKHCWDVIPKVIPSACECMWPIENLENIDYGL